MSSISPSALKSYFLTGSTPTQGQFAELIDSCHNLPGGLFVHRFMPEIPSSSFQIYGNVTTFNTNNASEWFNMFVFIPPAANLIKSIQLVGQNYRGFLPHLLFWHFSDVLDNNFFSVQEHPGYWHALYQSPVPLPLGSAAQDFNVQIPISKDLKFSKYRYFLLQMNIRTLPASGTYPAGYLTLKPFGLEFE